MFYLIERCKDSKVWITNCTFNVFILRVEDAALPLKIFAAFVAKLQT